ncbi:MAG: GtrA family protein [Cyanobacteria bacterium P01_G01_bin.54]
MVITKRKSLSLDALLASPKVRWLVVGVLFTGLNFPVLYFLGQLPLPEVVVILITSEVSLVVRFFVNDRWVFGQTRPTWTRFWQYHVATASSLVIWNGATIAATYFLSWQWAVDLPDWLRLQFAAVIGTGCSFGWSMFTNFFWVWRRPQPPQRPSER